MMGKLLVLLGLVLVVIGLAVHFAPGMFHWIGRLPGDIHFDNGRTKVFIPITSMILISIGLSIAIHLIRRFL